MHPVSFCSQIFTILGDLKIRNDGRFGPFCNRDRIPQMVAVRMSDENKIGLYILHFVHSSWVSRNKRIN